VNNCLIKNFSLIWILAIASVFLGIGNGFYHVGFEAWLIQEYGDVRNLSNFYIFFMYSSI
jgi:hypothetical protein